MDRNDPPSLHVGGQRQARFVQRVGNIAEIDIRKQPEVDVVIVREERALAYETEQCPTHQEGFDAVSFEAVDRIGNDRHQLLGIDPDAAFGADRTPGEAPSEVILDELEQGLDRRTVVQMDHLLDGTMVVAFSLDPTFQRDQRCSANLRVAEVLGGTKSVRQLGADLDGRRPSDHPEADVSGQVGSTFSFADHDAECAAAASASTRE